MNKDVLGYLDSKIERINKNILESRSNIVELKERLVDYEKAIQIDSVRLMEFLKLKALYEKS